MDSQFHPAIAAITAGNLDGLRDLIGKNPSLATARSSCSHPTLLQCLALEAVNVRNKVEMAKVLIDAGADINGALGAAACIDNVEIAALLLDCGAAIDGTGSWSPLEEALYWRNDKVRELLVARGASAHNLRIASGLGRLDLIESFFRADGSLKPEAGKIDWPFGELQAKAANGSAVSQDIVNNAFIYACNNNQIEAARLLIEKGAQINAIPPGFDYSGTGLHYAAMNGLRALVEFLVERGADVNVKDTKVGSTAAGWADHGGHPELKEYLERISGQRQALT